MTCVIDSGHYEWIPFTLKQGVTDRVIDSVLEHARIATEAAPRWGKAWHAWGVHNVAAMEHYASPAVGMPHVAQRHTAPAVTGYFRSVALSQTAGKQAKAT